MQRVALVGMARDGSDARAAGGEQVRECMCLHKLQCVAAPGDVTDCRRAMTEMIAPRREEHLHKHMLKRPTQ